MTLRLDIFSSYIHWQQITCYITFPIIHVPSQVLCKWFVVLFFFCLGHKRCHPKSSWIVFLSPLTQMVNWNGLQLVQFEASKKSCKRSGREARGQWNKTHPAPKLWPPNRLLKHRRIETRLIKWRRWICSLWRDYSRSTAIWRVKNRSILKKNTSVIWEVKRGW